MGSPRYVSTFNSKGGTESDMFIEIDDVVFSIDQMNRRLSGLKTIELGKHKFDPGKSDVPFMHAFQSSDRHTDFTAQDISERWGISVITANKTLKKNTQKFLRSAVLPLSRIYSMDRVFSRKTLLGYWSTDKMETRCKSLEGNKYAQAFTNKAYFSGIYPMYSNRKAGDALWLFCQAFGVPKRLTFDGSK